MLSWGTTNPIIFPMSSLIFTTYCTVKKCVMHGIAVLLPCLMIFICGTIFCWNFDYFWDKLRWNAQTLRKSLGAGVTKWNIRVETKVKQVCINEFLTPMALKLYEKWDNCYCKSILQTLCTGNGYESVGEGGSSHSSHSFLLNFLQYDSKIALSKIPIIRTNDSFFLKFKLSSDSSKIW